MTTRSRIIGTIRGYELESHWCPANDAEFRKWWRRELRRRATPAFETIHNSALNPGLASIAAYMAEASSRPAWQSGRPRRLALGTGMGDNPSNLQKDALNAELYRKLITDRGVSNSGGSPVAVFTTYFSPVEVFNPQTVTTANPVAADGYMLLGINQPAGFRAGDTVRLDLPSGYTYLTVAGVQNVAPYRLSFQSTGFPANVPIGTVVSQCISEAGMFGDDLVLFGVGGIPPVDAAGEYEEAWTEGTFTAGSNQVVIRNYANAAEVSLRRPPFTADHVGQYIRAASPTVYGANPPSYSVAGPWARIAAVGEVAADGAYNIQILTLEAPYPLTHDATTAPGGRPYYEVRGTMFSRTSTLRYVKSATKGFVFENEWAFEGA